MHIMMGIILGAIGRPLLRDSQTSSQPSAYILHREAPDLLANIWSGETRQVFNLFFAVFAEYVVRLFIIYL